MAVGYQYQSDYDKKENKKGFKKKFVILGVGLALLVVIAIVGAPKKQASQDGINIGSADDNFHAEIITKDDPTLSNILLSSKEASDSFMINLASSKALSEMVFDKNIKEEVLVKDVRSAINISGSTCEYLKFMGYADYGKTLPSFSYKCVSGSSNIVVFIALKDGRIFNWGGYAYSSSSDLEFNKFIKKIHGEL